MHETAPKRCWIYLQGRWFNSLGPSEATGRDASDARTDASQPSDAAAWPGLMGSALGLGLFETFLLCGNRSPLLAWHLERLHRSARALGLPAQLDLDRLAHGLNRAVAELRRAEAAPWLRLRMQVVPALTTGPGEAMSLLGSEPPTRRLADRRTLDGQPEPTALDHPATHALAWLIAEPCQPPMPYYRNRALRLGLPSPRTTVLRADRFQGHKVAFYWPRLKALAAGRQEGFDEVLWQDDDHNLVGACVHNLVARKGDCLLTPSSRHDTPEGCSLAGVTRRWIIRRWRAWGWPVELGHVDLDKLHTCDEIAICNARWGLRPARVWAGQRQGDDPATPSAAARAFARLQASWLLGYAQPGGAGGASRHP